MEGAKGSNDCPPGSGVEVELKRDLTLFDVTMIGVGAMIGAGIFVLTGSAARVAGPAAIVALILNGVVTLFTAMAYAELGSSFPEAGGGYLWAKEALPQPSGFISGWISWVAHSIACSLYAVGFGSYTAWLLSEYYTLPFGLEAAVLTKIFAVLIILIFMVINYMGTEETGKAEGIITMAKIIILAVFIGGGLNAVLGDPEASGRLFDNFLPGGGQGIFLAMGIIFIGFQGYEVIAQCGEETKDPKRNIPKAIFYSIAIVVVIYVLVMTTYIGLLGHDPIQAGSAYEGEHYETIILRAAEIALGPVGLAIMAIGGLMSTTSALNATIFSSSRVSFAMGRDGSLPKALGKIHSKRNTPYLAVFLSCAIIIIMALTLPIERIAASADVMFLILFTITNICLISLRYKKPDLDRGYRVPLVPIIPIIGIAANIFLAAFIWNFPGEGNEVGAGQIAWYVAMLWIFAGLLIYYFTGGKEELETITEEAIPSPLTRVKRKPTKGKTVLLPIADFEDRALVRLGAEISKRNDAELYLLHIREVPRGTPPSAISYKDLRHEIGKLGELESMVRRDKACRVRAKIKVAHEVYSTIIETIKDENIDIVVLGWHGPKGSKARILGTNIDEIVQNAPCDTILFKTYGERFDYKNIAIVSGGDWHATHAAQVASDIAKFTTGQITVLAVPESDSQKDDVQQYSEKLQGICISSGTACKIDMASTQSLVQYVKEKASSYDLIVLGATEEWRLKRYAFGGEPDQLLKTLDRPVIVVRKVVKKEKPDKKNE